MADFYHEQLDLSSSYLKHNVFADIKEMREYYDCISYSCFFCLRPGTIAFTNYASYIYTAMSGTLGSISELFRIGRMNDAIVLTRKFYDDVMMDLYLEVIRKEKCKSIVYSDVEEVNKWLTKKIRMPRTSKILKLLETSDCCKELYPYFGWKTNLQKSREFLDDSVHGNLYYRVLLNCNSVYLNDRETQLNNIQTILHQMVQVHIAYTFYLNPTYLMASTYIDCLECNETPPEGSEYWIAPFAQEAFNKFIKSDKVLSQFIQMNCPLEIE